MSNIITISREFGSGGRELGKRLSEALNIPCYDHQIIEMVAKQEHVSPNYVESISEKDIRSFYPTTIGRSVMTGYYEMNPSVQIAVAEHKLLKQLAAGDCIIVGRAADAVLEPLQPFNIFVYADEETKLARCLSRLSDGEAMSDKEIIRQCKKIDKQRRAYHELYSDKKWGEPEGYHLCVNTSGREIKQLIPGLTAYIKDWFAAKI